MKHLLFASFLLLASAGSTFASGPRPDRSLVESPPSHLDDDGPLHEPRHVRFGMTPADVRAAMHGKPDVQLTPDLWVYWHFHSGMVSAEKFDTLIVSFAGGRVTQYRLVERKAVRALLQTLKPAPPPAGDVAKK